MTEILHVIKDFLMYLLPAGGMGGVIVWVFNKKLRTLRTDKEVHDTYKAMYDDVKKELKELRNENKVLRRELARVDAIIGILEAVFSKVASCRYYNSCPIRVELQQLEKYQQRKPRSGSDSGKRKLRKPADPDTGVKGEPSDTAGEPPGSTGGGILL